ncbi:MAG: hypothetical protein D6732_24405 [Methanobacteriota archaeon]|nr:MAG: hypothetical protein D6732_24405 [Euryarchaeota archaeon]
MKAAGIREFKVGTETTVDVSQISLSPFLSCYIDVIGMAVSGHAMIECNDGKKRTVGEVVRYLFKTQGKGDSITLIQISPDGSMFYQNESANPDLSNATKRMDVLSIEDAMAAMIRWGTGCTIGCRMLFDANDEGAMNATDLPEAGRNILTSIGKLIHKFGKNVSTAYVDSNNVLTLPARDVFPILTRKDMIGMNPAKLTLLKSAIALMVKKIAQESDPSIFRGYARDVDLKVVAPSSSMGGDIGG